MARSRDEQYGSTSDLPPESGLKLWPIRRALVVTLVIALFLTSALTVAGLASLGFPGIKHQAAIPLGMFFDILKLAFAVVAGVGATFALVMAYRRQRVAEAANRLGERAQSHAEKVAQDSARDATERRVTELYGRAVEQLGHPSAAVRLGGLYSLERLAQGHAEHRQTIVDMICAYLRMPFEPPASLVSTPASFQTKVKGKSAGNLGLFGETGVVEVDPEQELQVRLAAQRLLTRHLAVPPSSGNRPGGPAALPETYWETAKVDLNGAFLVDFDFRECRTHHADFRKVRFVGETWFEGAHFSGSVTFDEAEFDGTVWFGGARFGETARFREVRFGRAEFDDAHFGEDAWFSRARFGDSTGFRMVRFGGRAWFGGARFEGDTWFGGARFDKGATFDEAEFDGTVWFGGARFEGNTWFGGARFRRAPDFHAARAVHQESGHWWPRGWQLAKQSQGEATGRLRRAEEGDGQGAETSASEAD